ncbi:hypothetical protein AZE42_11830 [Rhizopogon vesiculosus]|uniref:Uncharacterized protein n=1 Tax=Rhizopogon vesiculosus TaxID=180088 RepID=A0A1J8QGC3_9AGAM|nr:hypothetical protein AZE42_11830 [Rhizopogon vesiculosus]
MLRRKQTRTIVLSRIHDLVTSYDFIPSSVALIINSCTAILPPAEFPDLLQSRNLDGHAAMYWAMIHNRREALSVLCGFISQFSSVYSPDLRSACEVTNDHALFNGRPIHEVSVALSSV